MLKNGDGLMNDDNFNENTDADQDPEMEQCAPGCYCKKVAPKTRVGIIVCLVVAIAALFGSMYVCGNKNHLSPNVTQRSEAGARH